MNILSFSSDRSIFEPGSAVRSRTLAYGRLVDELHIVVYAKRSLGFSNEVFPPNIFLYPTNTRTRFGYIVGALRHVYALKRRGMHIDVVTAQDPFEIGIAAFFAARILGAKLHLQVHTDFLSSHFSNSFSNRARVFLARFLIPRARALRVVSERIRQSLVGMVRAGVPVTVLPILVTPGTDALAQDGQDLKKKYPQFDFCVLMASRLVDEKNIPMALMAMQEIVRMHPRVGLVVCGEGPLRGRLEALVCEMNLSDHVVFEGWCENPRAYMQTADLFLLTSNFEGYAMSVVEALLSGCPVVMTDVGCAGEVVQDGVNGIVVPVGDVQAVVRAVDEIVSGQKVLTPKISQHLPREQEYLSAYRGSWEDALH